MNVELVYIILMSINGFMENIEIQTDNKSERSIFEKKSLNKITIKKNKESTKITYH